MGRLKMGDAKGPLAVGLPIVSVPRGVTTAVFAKRRMDGIAAATCLRPGWERAATAQEGVSVKRCPDGRPDDEVCYRMTNTAMKQKRWKCTSIALGLFAVIGLCACQPATDIAKTSTAAPTFEQVRAMPELPPPFTRRPQITSELRLKPGQVLDPASDFAKAWTGRNEFRKLANGMVFEIPAQYGAFMATHSESVMRRQRVQRLDELPVEEGLGFALFMPDFTGVTPDTVGTDQLNPDWVWGSFYNYKGLGEERPGEAGSYPPNVEARLQKLISKGYTEKYGQVHGLTCYHSLTNNPEAPRGLETGDTKACIGIGAHGHPVYFNISIPPFNNPLLRYPRIDAYYFTPEYGGLYIEWHVGTKHLARWKEIDAFIWRALEEWTIVNPYAKPPTR